MKYEVIKRCEKMVTVTDESGQSVERSRPLIPTSRCEDNEPELCGSLFKIPPEVAADNLDESVFSRYKSTVLRRIKIIINSHCQNND